jgi:tRNA dimethylallyltransferase
MTPLIFLMGPTAAGKTELAVVLIKHFPCDIISVDSAMIYRGMDIGTAKPNAEILAQAPHRLLDILDPAESYSVGQFLRDAQTEIQTIQKDGRIPLLVGGTMLYFHSLQQGLSILPLGDAQVRYRINQQAKKYGWAALHEYLATIDPQSARRIHPNDSQRIQRAIEVYELSGSTLTQWYAKETAQTCCEPIIKLILSPPHRGVLHAKIAQRFHTMLKQGLIEEVEHLYQRDDLNLDLPAMRCVGYRQAWHYLAGELDYNGLIERGIVATRQLAKRQLSWLRQQTATAWFDSQQPNVTEQILNYLKMHPLLSHYC